MDSRPICVDAQDLREWCSLSLSLLSLSLSLTLSTLLHTIPVLLHSHCDYKLYSHYTLTVGLQKCGSNVKKAPSKTMKRINSLWTQIGDLQQEVEFERTNAATAAEDWKSEAMESSSMLLKSSTDKSTTEALNSIQTVLESIGTVHSNLVKARSEGDSQGISIIQAWSCKANPAETGQLIIEGGSCETALTFSTKVAQNLTPVCRAEMQVGRCRD